MDFTVEEINFMCIYGTKDRGSLLAGVQDGLPYLLEPELKELAQSVIGRLEAMSDLEFAVLDLIPQYDDEEEKEVQHG